MKKVLMFTMPGCPHCVRAKEMMEELYAAKPAYREIEITEVDETAERQYADTFDYYYVPTFYVDGVKLHEGVPSKAAVERVFEAAVK